MKYKDFPVEFKAGVRTVTERGEHHTIRLAVPLPCDFRDICEGVITFKTWQSGRGATGTETETPYIFPSEGDFPMWLEDNTLYIVLWENLTTPGNLQFCLEAQTEHKGRPQRVYSPDSETLRFDDHIGMREVAAPPGLIASIVKKLPILQKLGEKGGKLTFGGDSIGGWNPRNKKALSHLTESPDGQPLWKGEPWPGGESTTLEDLLTPLAQTLTWILNGGEPPNQI